MLFPDNNRENKCEKFVIKSIRHLNSSSAQHEWASIIFMLPISEAIRGIEILQTLIFRMLSMHRVDPFSNNDFVPEQKHGISMTNVFNRSTDF